MGLFDGNYEGGFWGGFWKGGAEGFVAGGPFMGFGITAPIGAIMGGISGAQQQSAEEQQAEDERIRSEEALREIGAQNQASAMIYAGASGQARRSTRAQINNPINSQPMNQGILGQSPGSRTSGTF